MSRKAAVEGNEKWRQLDDEDRFEYDDILESYINAKNKHRWRISAKPKTYRCIYYTKNFKKNLGFTNIRKLAKELGITREAAWRRIYRTKKSWNVSTNSAFAIVKCGLQNQGNAKQKVLPNMKFGILTTIRLANYEERPQNVSVKMLKRNYWLCKCECGRECFVQSSSLKSGHSKSCGHCGYYKGKFVKIT